MEHDTFHVASKLTGGGATQQWETLYTRLCELMEIPFNLTEEEVYQRWQKNLDICNQKFQGFGKEKKFTLEFVMFFILHEPGLINPLGLDSFTDSFGNRKDEIKSLINNTDKWVVTPESSFIRNRIRMGGLALTIIKRLNHDFFGLYANDAVPHLKWALMYIHRLSTLLSDLPFEADMPAAQEIPDRVIDLDDDEDELSEDNSAEFNDFL
jgi:hypothetical protein